MSDFELPPKPPSTLPNGKQNPEYQKWYRQTRSGKAAIRRYQKSAKGKETHKKYRQSEKGIIVRRKNRPPAGHYCCIECGLWFPGEDVLSENWRTFGPTSCLCQMCQEEEREMAK